MPAILSPVSRTLKFGVNVPTRQTEPYFCPAGSEITTTIAAINGIVQGTASIDYSVAAANLVQNGTATWVSAALVYTTAGTFVQKVYDDCYVRANVTSGTFTFYINPAGSSITPTYNPFLQYAQAAPTPGPPPSAPYIITAVPGLGTDNSPGWASQVAEGGSLLTQTTSGRVATAGDYLFNALNDVHPLFSPVMFARGAVRFVPGPNLPGTTSAPGPGAPAAMFRILARCPANPDVQAYEPDIGGFNMDGSGVSQANVVHGIRFPNPNPGSNSFDPDPNFTTNKDYTAAFLHDIDITNFSGDGVNVEAGRGRLHVFSVRALNCLGNGFTLGGNDKIFGGHWAGGGNGNPATGTGWSVLAGQASGFYGVTGNVWSNQNSQSANSGAMFFRAAKLFILGITELNSWCRFDGGVNYYEPGAFIGNMFHLHGVNFTSDGVGNNVLHDGDTRVNACTGWTEYQNGSMLWNKYARTDQVGFNTPGNFGGFVDGSVGTAVQYLHDVSTGGQTPCLLNVAEDYSTAPDSKPWTDLQHAITAIAADANGNILLTSTAHGLQTNDVIGVYCTGTAPGNLPVGVVVGGNSSGSTPLYVSAVNNNTFNVSLTPIWNSTQVKAAGSGGTLLVYSTPGTGSLTFTSLSSAPYLQNHGNLVNYLYQDSYRALFRVGALTPKTPPTGVVPLLPLIGLHSHIALGISEANDINPTYFIELGDSSGTGTARNICYANWEFDGGPVQYTDSAYGVTTTQTGTSKGVKAPWHLFTTAGGGIASYTIQFPTDQNASSFGNILSLIGGTITTLNCTVSGSGSINTSYVLPPTSSPGVLTIEWNYRRDTNQVYITRVTEGPGGGAPLGRVDGKQVDAGFVGDSMQRVNNPVTTTALTTATPANLASVTLTPGVYLIIGSALFTAPTTAAVSSVQYGLTETSATIPGTKDESYGAQQYGTAGLSMTALFQTGVVFQRLAVSAATTVYLTGQANFGSGTVSAGGTILPLRVG